MKKILALVLCVVVCLSVSGCGEKKEVQYAKAPEASVPAKGAWDGNVYTNSFSELTFEKPEGWISATDDELATLDVAEGVFYDMMCQDPETGSQVAIMHEELLLTTGSITITEDMYIESLSESFYNSGLEVISQEDVTIGENTYKSVMVYGEAEDISMTQYSIVRKVGNTMVSIMVVAFNDTDIEEIIAYFG